MKVKYHGLREARLILENEDYKISYDNRLDSGFNWGTVSVFHKKTRRIFMYNLFAGQIVPRKYKDDIETFKVKFDEVKKEKGLG